MSVEEALEAVVDAMTAHAGGLGASIRDGDSSAAESTWGKLLEAINAYALVVHVDVCGIKRDERNEFRICGEDGWYCDKAKEIIKSVARKEKTYGGHAIGWDGCASCFGCKICNEVEGDCCVDCTYNSEFTLTRIHDCPTCHCDGATIGNKYSNQICNCEHNCAEEK